MKNFCGWKVHTGRSVFLKILIIMRVSFVLMFITTLNITANVYSQQTRLDLEVENISIRDVFKLIESKSELRFFYSDDVLNLNKKISLSVKNTSIDKILNEILSDGILTYKILDDNVVVITPFVSLSQNIIRGVVTDFATGEPLPGVNIIIEGTTRGVVTNIDGEYTIDIDDEDAVLVFSFVGYLTEKVAISGQSVIDIILTPDIQSLEEAIIVGYGTQVKKDIIGSVSVVDMKAMKSIKATTAEQALQGQTAGVNIISSGVPGGENSVFIRGINGFQNTRPLIIVDGVQGQLRDLNPEDIETMQVLKDAGAASIYGVRGANGVILVTTKKGKSGKSTISYDAYYGVQKPPQGNVFNLMNPSEYASVARKLSSNPLYADENNIPDYMYGYFINDNPSKGVANVGDLRIDPALYNYDPGDYSNNYLIQAVNKEGTDWFDEIFNDAPVQSHTLTASGGSDAANYLFSLGHLNQQGTLLNSYLKRYTLRVNTQYNVGKRIRIGENLYGFYKKNPNGDNIDRGTFISSFINQYANSAIGYAYRTSPFIPVHDIEGNYGGSFASPNLQYSKNVVAMMERTNRDINDVWGLSGNIYAEADFLKYFTARTNFGGGYTNQYFKVFTYNEFNELETFSSENQLTERTYENTGWTWTNTITFKHVFLERHNVKVLVGTEAIKNTSKYLSGSAADFLRTDEEFLVLGNGRNTSAITTQSGGGHDALYSLFSRIDYAFDDQYLFGATIRRDGSSKFGENNRYGVFPSFSLGWRLSNAVFMKNIEWLSDLKLRGSWGKMGSQNNIGNNNIYSLYSADFGRSYYDLGGNNSLTPGYYAESIGNGQTTWEEDIMTNIGFDIAVLNNRINFSAEWYKKKINGLLLPLTVPRITGGAYSPTVNIGDIQNEGLDFIANYHSEPMGRFKFDVGLNFTTYQNKITKLPNSIRLESGGTGIGAIVLNDIGYPVSAFYGYDVVGVFDDEQAVEEAAYQVAAAPGRFQYRDIDNNGTIDTDDRTFIGNPNPDFTYGINLSAAYDNFDFSMMFYGSQGNEVFNFVRYFSDFWSSPSSSKSKDLLNAWTTENPTSEIPRVENFSTFSTSGVVNSYYVEDGSFLKCRSLILGYTLKPSLAFTKRIEKLRIYLQGANLFTITGYSGVDPELVPINLSDNSSFGIDYGHYPTNQKSYIIGINLTF